MKRFLVVTSVTLVVLIGLAAVCFFGVGFYLSPQNPLQKADAIVAISGGETQARTATAVQLYKEGWAPILIFSGAAADPTGPSNARAMATVAESEGVPTTAILLDETSINTSENAINVAAIVGRNHLTSIILVTSPYHQRRAEIAFHRALGASFPIINHSSFDSQWRRSDWWATSYSRNLTYSELQKVIYELITGNSA
jgi:uncharacterized SAM-binding protein YcdF (DUF218 family)